MALDSFQSDSFQTNSFQTGAAFILKNVDWTAYPEPVRFTALRSEPIRFTVHPPYEGGRFS